MKKLFLLSVIFVCTCISCTKEPPVSTSTPTAKAPVANAGTYAIVILPVDSVMLDGSASYDPDGKVEEYLWTQLSGPSAAELLAPQLVKTNVKRLHQGTYSFELTIKDNGGLMSKDTVAVSVRLTAAGTVAANAGPDQVGDLAIGRAVLNGSASVDSLGLSLNYQWRQITGLPTQLLNSNQAVSTAMFSVANIYRFELRVWNANGEAYDTTQVTVKDDCTLSRTEVPAQLTHLKQFSFSAYNAGRLLAVGNKLIIPVDALDPIAVSAVIVYDVATGTFTEKELRYPRTGAATVVAGNKVFFAGGFINFNYDERPVVSDDVEIYDAASNTWSTAKLSEARGAIKAGVAGNKVVFAGGLKSNILSNKVDVYDLQTNQWTTSVMAGPPRAVERVVADDSKIYFLAGFTAWENPTGFGFVLAGASKTIDIYDATSGTWSNENIQVERYGFSAALANNQLIIAGGVTGIGSNEHITSNVEIITLPTMARSSTCLANASVWYGSEATAIKNGSVIFYVGGSLEKRKFNIYNPQTGAWSLGVHNFDVLGQNDSATVASINNQVYVLKGNSLFRLDY